jgi:hypothetical protein
MRLPPPWCHPSSVATSGTDARPPLPPIRFSSCSVHPGDPVHVRADRGQGRRPGAAPAHPDVHAVQAVRRGSVVARGVRCGCALTGLPLCVPLMLAACLLACLRVCLPACLITAAVLRTSLAHNQHHQHHPSTHTHTPPPPGRSHVRGHPAVEAWPLLQGGRAARAVGGMPLQLIMR